jgi:hypothetical protein
MRNGCLTPAEPMKLPELTWTGGKGPDCALTPWAALPEINAGEFKSPSLWRARDMVLATATPDLSTFAASNLAAESRVLSTQTLSAIVAQPFGQAPASARPFASAAVVLNGQTLPVSIQGLSATATNTGWGSISQAAVSISFTMAPPPAIKPAR